MADDPWAAFRNGGAPTATVNAADPWAAFRVADRSGLDAEDIAKSGGIGVVRGGIGIAGMPGDIRQLASSGVDYIGGKMGVDPEKLAAAKDKTFNVAKKIPLINTFTNPGSQEIQKGIEGYTGEFYKPQTKGGEFAQTIGEFAPAGLLGPASLARKVGMQVALPAIASEAAGQQAKGTVYEPYARIAGAIASPVAASKVGTGLVETLGALGPGTGGQSVRTAFQSGAKGGETGQAFRDNMRGNVPLEDVVTEAKTALGNMRGDRSANYNKDMAGMRAAEAGPYPSAPALKFDEIDKAINNTNNIKNFKGKDLSPETAEVRNKIGSVVDEWKSANPLEFHTPLGMDALKQRIGSIKDSLPYGSPERVIAEQAYNAVRGTITKQVPEYANAMKGYEQASTQIGEIEKTLSLGKKATNDTALRKLQSVTRNNVNTNYGKRADLAEVLAQNGAPDLMEKLSGQAMNAWTPRGLNRLTAGGSVAASFLNPAALAALPAMSPRIVGEVAHAAGRAVGGVNRGEDLARALLGSKPIGKLTKKQQSLIAALNAEQSLPQ